MGLLDKLKSLLGRDDRQTRRRQGGSANVTVEHEPDAEPAAETEAAVKGTGGADDRAAGAAAGSAAESGTATQTDTGVTDGPAAGAEPDEGTEATPGEATTEPDEPESGESEERAVDGEGDAEADEPESAGPDESGEASEPVDSINGIGPTYAERLEAAGIETVGDLATADIGTVADAAEAPESRVTGWLEQARNR
jgi:predicted flap endonuclease-1-like 5' DNA nuclease